jgi:HK97 gp10 family phage protein
MRFTVQAIKRGGGGRFERFDDKIKAALRRGLTAWGLLAVAKAKELIIRGPKTGRIYIRGGNVTHRASAPGEPPANDTGRLVASIRYELTSSGTVLRVFAGTEYAAMLEFGTSKMSARPFLRRAIEETQARGMSGIEAEIRKTFRR